MIHYQLRCAADHGFDGWFKGSAAFDDQVRRGLVACPECGDVQVRRALMAPALARTENVPQKAALLPDQLRAALQRIRAEVERTSDYVGPDFADEARRIHRGETEKRAIYGESTPADAEALTDEGIEFSRIPWVDRADG